MASPKRAASPTSHGVDDFYVVGGTQGRGGVLAARNDLAIDFHGDAAIGIAVVGEQLRQSRIVCAIMRVAVE